MMNDANVISISQCRLELNDEIVREVTRAVRLTAEQVGYRFFVEAVCDRSNEAEVLAA